MADKKISALTAASTPLAGTEVLPIVQGGSTVKVSIANVTAGRAVSTGALSVATADITLDNAYALKGKLVAGSAVGMIKRNSADEVAIDEDGYGAKIGFGGRYNFAGGGDFTVGVGNVVIGTAAKGITTGSSIPLGFGVNNSVSAVTISTSSNLLVGTTVDAGALANTQAVTAGKFQTFSGETASLVNGATEDITGLVSGATYLVVCRGSANTTTFVIHTAYVNAAGGVTLAVLSSGNGFVLTSPANNTLRVTSLVSTQTYPYTLTRIF